MSKKNERPNADGESQNSLSIHDLIPPAPGDPIRIVPPMIAQDVAAADLKASPPANAVYLGGPLIKNVEVFTVFWGYWWQSPTQQPLIDSINSFFKTILQSPLIDQISKDYSTPQYPIGQGKFIGTATITTPKITHSISDAAIQTVIQSEIANGTLPAPDMNKLYFVYLPLGVVAVQGGSRSCQSFCGYHGDISGKIFYAVMPYAGCQGCVGGMVTLDALTATSSHELCEAITDPIPGTGWYNNYHGEIGDYCAWQMKPARIGGYMVQKEWSNSANGCV